MKLKRRFLFRASLIGLPLVLLAAFGLQGFRGGWHGHHNSERLEGKIRWIEEDLAEDLKIRPEQREGFQALTGQFRSQVQTWMTGWQETGTALKTELENETPDKERVSSLLKERVRRRPTNESLEALIDQTLAFYETLDPEQQRVLNKKISRHLAHRF